MTDGLFPPLREDRHEVALSPGLYTGPDQGAAIELKVQLPVGAAEKVEAWAWDHLSPDPHGAEGTYHITSIYCDTPGLDVFHRSPGFRRRKYRVRRYDDAALVFLERKTRRKDRVRKRRTAIPAAELGLLGHASLPTDWAGDWFLRRVQDKGLRPTGRVAYRRTAFFGRAGDAAVRLTLDRDLVGAPADGWALPARLDGHPLLPGVALLELKFHVHLPALFQDLLAQLPVQPGRVSKYRQCVEVCGLTAG